MSSEYRKSHQRKLRNGTMSMKRNIRNVNLFDQRETYEIEVEIDNDKVSRFNFDDLMLNLKKVIKYILCGLQNTNYPVSNSQMNKAIQEYLKLANISKEHYKINPRDFIGPSTITLQQINLQDIDEEEKNGNKCS